MTALVVLFYFLRSSRTIFRFCRERAAYNCLAYRENSREWCVRVIRCCLRCCRLNKRFTYFMRSRCATDSVGYWIGNSSFISFGRSLMIVRTVGDTHIYIYIYVRFYHKSNSKTQHTTKAACNCLCILIPGRDLPYMRWP